MRFISPKTDFAFKRIFGSTDSKDILISFLNALLYAGQSTIQDLDIIDPYSAASITSLKDSYLDVKAQITGDKTVIIEMQVLNVAAFEKRVIYNAAKTYATQLKSGEGYSKLNPVIALTITDFEMFESTEAVISHFVLKEREELFDYPNPEIELVFVELPKFDKELDELTTLTEKWIYFMKNTPNLDAIPNMMETVPEIQKAFRIANQANLSPQELEDLEKREIFMEDQRGAILKGIEEGRQAGIEEGKQEGRQEGIKEGQLTLILRLLERRIGEVTPDVITRIRGLSSQELENLGEAVLGFGNVSDLTAWLQVNAP
ncbi:MULTISPECIES: Rpn family recombination-promoting nuclease/putative transposase [unclassified Coleofasciculus]|uniref:Rpn family recombination-promoting nuclease/putative transposase n=1 Tax=unclassified Coleofasciculus TaxID=2692782 RepID=UPI00187F8D19|nr:MULTISPECIES: Rpn family recombination-promoting nuclease/putative transposase [unclassified Coleofasciculus]MBE9128967.1 Rpn family recombination-promoting nuclease/putative transposase [Coleofasciculus sp. LEGE 07081]MBE9151695.1 Rpn family recombination-promoting nuclease/putative transposase [Coleofasciculus sp. LEGE 07092]